MNEQFTPELGQACFGNPAGEYKVPDYVEALIAFVFEEISRVYWNANQNQWDRGEHGIDLGMGGIEYSPYYWGDDEVEAAKPNFKYDDVEIRWYKHFGRSMSCNVEMTPEEWVCWFNLCLMVVRSYDRLPQRRQR